MTTALELLREAAGSQVMPEDRLDSMGLDSLDFIQLVNAIEEAQGITIAPAHWAEAQTADDVIQLVRRARRAADVLNLYGSRV